MVKFKEEVLRSFGTIDIWVCVFLVADLGEQRWIHADQSHGELQYHRVGSRGGDQLQGETAGATTRRECFTESPAVFPS